MTSPAALLIGRRAVAEKRRATLNDATSLAGVGAKSGNHPDHATEPSRDRCLVGLQATVENKPKTTKQHKKKQERMRNFASFFFFLLVEPCVYFGSPTVFVHNYRFSYVSFIWALIGFFGLAEGYRQNRRSWQM